MIKLDTTPVPAIAELRKKIIWDGKHSKKFQKVPKKYLEAQPAKYKELDNLENSGAINELDAMILFHLVQQVQPQDILEIGTWFGTSAGVMLAAMQNKVGIYTCDKHDFFILESPFIYFRPWSSWDFLNHLRKRKIGVDMIFADGQLYGRDAKRANKLCRKKVFVTHDYEGKEKGYRNIKQMKQLWPNATFIPPVEGSTIAVLYEES